MVQGRATSFAVWHGTTDEVRQLCAAVVRHCTCAIGTREQIGTACAAHRMLTDQRVLDHLLYVYRTRERFRHAEWSRGPSVTDEEPPGLPGAQRDEATERDRGD